MILLPVFKDKKIAVFGLGVSGQATVASLCASDAEVYAWDESEKNLEACRNIHRDAVYAEYHKWPWKEIEVLVLSPGVPFRFPTPHSIVNIATIYGCEIVCDVELMMQARPEATYIGITGTNGKSTTTALVAHLLESSGAKVQMGGNIGKAALALQPLGKDGIYVLEMSSYQLDLMLRSIFDVAILLNISPDHLDRHGGMDGYIAAKKHIFDGMGVHDTAIISRDDEHCRLIANEIKGGKNLYSWQDSKPEVVVFSSKDELPVDVTKIATLQGAHNKQNVLAAIAACKAVGYSMTKIKKAFKSFAGLPHRMQPLTFKTSNQDILCVNDSKATNAEAAAHALATYENIFWIAGGKAKEGGIESLAPHFSNIKKAFLIGDSAGEFSKTLRSKKVKCVKSGTMEKAVAAAHKEASKLKEKSVILLSPAAASFDQYANFEARGEHFVTQVTKIVKASEAKALAKDDAA